MAKDTLFQNTPVNEDFRFNDQVAEIFDDMLDRSVPCYRQVIDMTVRILAQIVTPGDTIYDFGSSTGTTLLELSRKLEEHELQFIGVDNSAAMIEKATRKIEMFGKRHKIKCVNRDINDFTADNAGAILLNYTLQFIRPMLRQGFIARVFDFLRPGGCLIISEKVISHDPLLNRKFISCHHRFKKEQGYSEMEIAAKREALENILIPFSIDENKKMLAGAGFRSVETFFQWFNFVSLVAIKG